jgi:hypothetical protein
MTLRRKLLLGLGAAAITAASCGDDAAPGASTASAGGTGGGSSSTASTTTSSSTSTSSSTTGAGGATSTCSPEPIPSVVPKGWVEYTDWSCSCRFYVPATREALPPPLEWGSCPDATLTYSCRHLVVPGSNKPYSVGVHPSLDALSDGNQVLALNHPDYSAGNVIPNWHLVAEVDGAVRSAMLDVTPAPTFPKCILNTGPSRGGRHVLGVKGDGVGTDYSTTTVEGALGGSIDDLHPKVLVRHDDQESYNWTGGEKYVLQGSAPSFRVYAYDWSIGAPTLVANPSSDPDHLGIYDETPVGDAIFFETSGAVLSGINVWTPAKGAQPFIRWIGDPLHGAGSFGTDGKDMAWRYGEGRDEQGWYETVNLMTAKFTADPNAVVAKAVYVGLTRRDSIGAETVGVGCGYAATLNHLQGNPKGNVLIIRLADGRRWNAPGSPAVKHSRVIGVSCADVFVLSIVTPDPHATIVRIALDSLGPGEPGP